MATERRKAPGGRSVQRRTRRVAPRGTKKRDTHARILTAGTQIARREGLRAASVPRVMGAAGLTTGGFYAHFPSKTAMDTEIVRELQSPLRGLEQLEESSGFDWLQRAVKRYLSVAHRDAADGCGYPAVLSEVASAPPEVRRALAEALEIRVAAFQPHVPTTLGISPRERTLATLALTIGGLLLSRAVQGSPISDDMIAACRKWSLPEAAAPGIKQPERSSR